MTKQTVFRSGKSLAVSARILLALVLIVGMPPALSVDAQASNLALNKPVTCSSIENAGLPCASAVDGNLGTRWSSAHGVDPQWIYVDLGQTYTISQVLCSIALIRRSRIEVPRVDYERLSGDRMGSQVNRFGHEFNLHGIFSKSD